MHVLTRPPRRRFKKTLPEAVQAVRQAHPDAQIEVWSMDEHRVGLQPILRRQWCRKGQRPLVSVQPRYHWLYLYGFVCPSSGASFWMLLPTVSTQLYSLALSEFATAVGAGPNKQVVLVIDRAGWHTSAKVTLPQGLHLVFLPPYSPELQPAERLWSLSNEVLVNRHFASLAELQSVQEDHCRTLLDQSERIRSRTCFHWWPKPTHCSSN